MNRPVKMYDLGPSPNSVKVRLALAFKKIPYERIAVDPQNREPVLKISGQPLTPVLLPGYTVVYDSYAIVRYLDANFPGEPRLFSPVRDTMKGIETWELFGRNEVGPAVSLMFGQRSAPSIDTAKVARANEMIN